MQSDVDSALQPARLWSTALGFGFVTAAMTFLLFVIAGIRTNLTGTGYSPAGFASVVEWLTNVANDSADHVEFSMPLVVASIAGLTALAASVPRVAMTKNLSVHDALALTVWFATIGLLTWAALIVFVWIRGALFDGIAVNGALAAVPPAAVISVVLSFIVGRLSLRPLAEQVTAMRDRRKQLRTALGTRTNFAADLTVRASLRRASLVAVWVVAGAVISVAGIAALLNSLYGMPLASATAFAAACSMFGIFTSVSASTIAAFRPPVSRGDGEEVANAGRNRRRSLIWETTTWLLGSVLTLTITSPLLLSGAGGLAISVWLFVALGAVVIRMATGAFTAMARARRTVDYVSVLRAERRLVDLLATSGRQIGWSPRLA